MFIRYGYSVYLCVLGVSVVKFLHITPAKIECGCLVLPDFSFFKLCLNFFLFGALSLVLAEVALAQTHLVWSHLNELIVLDIVDSLF